jgi:small GTP-binding protein
MKRVRAVFCGDALVGKSSIIQRFSTKRFSDTTSTVAAAFHSATVQIANQCVVLELWDTAGSERYHSVIPSFFRSASGVIVVYDVTIRETFERLRYWLEFARVHSPDGCEMFLVGNKIDLFRKRAVPYEEARSYAEAQNVGYVEVSAKSGEAIDTLFALLAGLSGNGTVEIIGKGNVIELEQSEECC